MDRQTTALRTVTAALLGGMWGGALVGLSEAVLVTITGGPADEYWLFPYAVVAYGIVGLVIGGAASIVLTLVSRRQSALGGAFGLSSAVLFLGMAIIRYHVVQRIFHEDLVMLSPLGIGVHLGIAAAAAVLAVVLGIVGARIARSTRGLVLAGVGLVVCLALTSIGAVLASPHPGNAATSRTAPATASGRPNVILIITDTLRADALGCYGAAEATPGLDAFATSAVRFANAYSQSSWTRPSIATILTSQYASVHGLKHKLDALPDRVTTLAEALHAQGYWTAGFVSNINVAPIFNFQQGFDEYTYLAPDFYFWATDSATRLAVYKGLRVARERFFKDRIYFYNYYQDAAVVDAAVAQWLGQHPPQPFFLLIHYMDPHDPYFAQPYNGSGVARVSDPDPAPSRRDELHHLYSEDVHYLDGYLQTLMRRLRTLDLFDNSVIAVTADHGEEFQEHHGWWHGTSLYEEEVHVPLLIKRAHEPTPGAVVTSIARSLDIAPTLMGAGGLSAPASYMGRDLFGAPAPESEPLFAEEDLEGNVLSSLRLGTWQLITANPENPRGLQPLELYDLARDPHELRNLAPQESERVAAMLRQLQDEQLRLAAAAGLDG